MVSALGAISAIAAVALIAYGVELYNYDSGQPIYVDGEVDKQFQPVMDAFRQNFIDNWERGGGAFVVYHKGKKVVDIWGGFADKSAHRLWRKDTMGIAFSCTKAVAAVCIAQLAERGHLHYDDLMTKYWPEFGNNGKENVTIRMIMNHQAGLPFTDNPIDFETGTNHELIAKVFENQKPIWPAGTALGYHAVTSGWLADQIIRRTDPKNRSVGQYYREEIGSKLDLDFHIGLPLEKTGRVARYTATSAKSFIQEYLHDPSIINIPNVLADVFGDGMLHKLANNVPWISFVKQMTLNNPELYVLEQAAVLGIGTTRELARMFEELRAGKLLTKEGMSLLLKDFILAPDVVTGAYTPRGQGLMIKQFTHNNKNITLIGHSGYGGQNVRMDFKNELTLAYMSNDLKFGFGDTARTYIRLIEALYSSLEEIN